MKIFLRIKHWQLFLILIGISLLLQITVYDTFSHNRDTRTIIWPTTIAILVYIFIFFGWFYTLGTNLYAKLPNTVSMNLTRFKAFLIIPIIYLMFILIATGFIASDKVVMGMGASRVVVLIIPIHLFSMFCIFYCLYFISKELKSVEWQRP